MLPFTGTLDLTGSSVGLIRHIDVAENAGSPAAARVLLRDGGASGPVLVDIRLAASESKHVDYSTPARFSDGLYIEVAAGTVRGSIQPA